MSLELLQGYSSAEEDDDRGVRSPSLSDDGEADGGAESADDEKEAPKERTVQKNRWNRTKTTLSGPSMPPPDPSLPSALEAFAEITGPPEFLNNCAGAPEETREALGVLDRKGRDRSKRDKRDLPAGAVVEAKAQLVAIRDRVGIDEGNNTTSASTAGALGESKKLITAANPGPEDAAELLRMCLQCGIPKTYSHARGMVCPLCGDRPPAEAKEPEKKKGSMIKDKEKSKRMKGQSSHATWKSETEMMLRQQYD